ncbi:MAG: beta-ketoacyl-[acyl-carrier-protein] synthase family protein [Spartobacteria bacterium]|nr:beta-ketoacyl-[acyl-carrier-protein] synthase family protein [Spartobacteria bacterium]
MSDSGTRVVITGCGMVTSLGESCSASWEALLQGRDGYGHPPRFDATPFGTCAICSIPCIPEMSYKADFPLDDASRLLLAAAADVLDDYGNELSDAPAFVATTLGGMNTGTKFFRQARRHPEQPLPHALIKDYLPFMPCRHLQAKYGLRQMPLSIMNACSSGANAVGLAYWAVKSGRCDRAIAAGYDVVSDFVYGGFNALRLISPDVCRPFDVHRTGLVLGEAAGVVVMEREEAARAAGRTSVAEVAAYAGATEGFHITKPDPSGGGAVAVMKQCLEQAGVSESAVDCVNAHGTGTLQNDQMEALAIAGLFTHPVAVTANKSAIGHTLGAAGLVETIFSALSIRDQVIPPVAHTRHVIPELEGKTLVCNEALPTDLHYVISTSFGFGGTNAAILLSTCEA